MDRDQERVDRCSEALNRYNLDAFVCAYPLNVLMLTGYWPVVGQSIAVVTKDAIRLLVPEDEQSLAQRGWADSIATFSADALHEEKTQTQTVSPALEQAVSKLGRARIGIEMDPESIPTPYVALSVYGLTLFHLIERFGGSSTIVSGDPALRDLRKTKTSAEIAKIRKACDVARSAFEEGLKAVVPGAKETEIAAAVQSRLSIDSEDEWQRSDGFVYCMSGPNAAHAYAAFQRSRARRIQEGDLVLVHCNSYVNGYWTDITRTVAVGEVDRERRNVLEAIEEARQAALDAVKPISIASQVDKAARNVMERRGLGSEFKHPLGHGVGFSAIDHNASPVLSPVSADTLEPGMVFNIEPGAYCDGKYGARHCDMVAIGQDLSPELLTDF